MKLSKVGDVLTSDVFGVPSGGVYVCGPGVGKFDKYLKRRFRNIRVGYVVCEIGFSSVNIYPFLFSGRKRFIPVNCTTKLQIRSNGSVDKVLTKAYAYSFMGVVEAWKGRKFSVIASDSQNQLQILPSDEFWELNQNRKVGFNFGSYPTQLSIKHIA
jgi:hypothetical protein